MFPNKSPALPIVLSIAGYDPSAGAGVLADLKTLSAIGVYGMACVTALTVQSTQGVRRVDCLSPDTVVETLNCLAEDASFAAIKVGMLGQVSVAEAVLTWLEHRPEIPVILDPVAKSSSGKDLLDPDGMRLLRTGWLGRANWITPNLSELADLAGDTPPHASIQTESLAKHLLDMAAEQNNHELKVVVTGGHAAKPDDLLMSATDCRWFPGVRIETTSTHGTGCTFSSALAARVALGDDDLGAVLHAKQFVQEALRQAYPVGRGNGPVNHFWNNFSEKQK